MLPDDALAALRRYPLLDALRERRSRRFGLGMAMDAGPLAYRSRYPGLRLTEGEEALLAFAACGVTGYALADLAYASGQGGTIMAGLLGRTVGSGDAIQSVAVFVTNAERYGRFPAYAPPVRTVLGFQASHVDVEFYDRFYRPGALAATQREHLARWHEGRPAGDPVR